MSDIETIAIFSPSLQMGGAERMMVVLANEFLQEGKSVSLLLANSQGPLRAELDQGVETVDFNQRGVFGALLPLARFLQTRHPDILLSAQSHANLMALLARRLARVNLPVVLSERTTMSVHYALEPGIKNRFVPPLARLLYRQADAVACISQGVADDIIGVTKISPERVHRIYNPALPPLAELAQKIETPVDHAWLLPEAPQFVLAVGRLSAAKDYPTLLRAFARVRRERDTNLLILGDGEKRAELENMIDELGLAGSVQMPGFVDNPYAYMARCAVFVLSSAWEGFSNVLVEALACGAPIVSTDCKYGPAEILENGRYGALVPVGDAAGMAQAILDALDGRQEPSALSRRASAFSHENAVQQYLDLFRTLHSSYDDKYASNEKTTRGGSGAA
ncbi:MAG: glycosyltransferase [Chloroflexi bacterium]|nr:glycosyltransferase [Chloroflexota bacterium]